MATFIDSPIGKKLCSRLTSGSTRDRVVIKNMRKIMIPILDDGMQKLIVNEVKERRIKAEELKAQANSILKSADQKAIDMIMNPKKIDDY